MERETVFSSIIRYGGYCLFSDFYKFCYNWLKDETGMDIITETKYTEKLKGDAKDINLEWIGQRKITDYFRFDIKINLKVTALTNVEINQGGAKVSTNKVGEIEMKVTGELVRDYNGKFETTPTRKFLRSIYEKWVIPARIEQFQGTVMEKCDEFLAQVKAYLDLESKK